jgi:hypothetical protein
MAIASVRTFPCERLQAMSIRFSQDGDARGCLMQRVGCPEERFISGTARFPSSGEQTRTIVWTKSGVGSGTGEENCGWNDAL